MYTNNKTIIYEVVLNALKKFKAELRKYCIACMGNTILAKVVKPFLSDMETFDQRYEQGNRESHASTRWENVLGKLHSKSKYSDMGS